MHSGMTITASNASRSAPVGLSPKSRERARRRIVTISSSRLSRFAAGSLDAITV
jgi:hypothetical protein